MEIRNNAQLRHAMMPVLRGVVDYILNQIAILNEEKIEEVVYAAYNPIEYERTYEFKDAWTVNMGRIHNKDVSGSFSYDPSKMSVSLQDYQHGSPMSGDAREYLADIIYQGLSGPLFGQGPWCDKRDAWDALIKAIGQKQIHQWTREGLAQYGLKIR